MSSTSSLHLRSRTTLLTKKFVCWGRQGQKQRGNRIFSNPDGESAKSRRSTSDVEYSDNHWCILWLKKKKKEKKNKTSPRFISAVSVIESGNDAAVMSSSSWRSSYCWKMYFCATLISSCDRILTENNKKKKSNDNLLRCCLCGCVSAFCSSTRDAVTMLCPGARCQVLNTPRRVFQAGLFLNSPANLHSLWVITARITILIA